MTPEQDGALLRAGFHSAEQMRSLETVGSSAMPRALLLRPASSQTLSYYILKSVVFKGHQPCEQETWAPSVHPGWTNSGAVTIPLSQSRKQTHRGDVTCPGPHSRVGLASRALSLSSLSIPAQFSAAAQRPQEGSLLRPGGLAWLLEGQFLFSVSPGLVLEPQTRFLLLEDEERGQQTALPAAPCPAPLLPAYLDKTLSYN